MLSAVCSPVPRSRSIPVMWIVFNALVLYNVTVVSGRFQELSRLDARPSSERPPRRARSRRFLLRLSAGGNCGFRHAGCDHQCLADRAGLSGARSCGLYLDLQYGAGGIRGSGSARDDTGRGHATFRCHAGRDDRPAAAFLCVVVAVLCCRSLRWSSRHQGCVAGAPGRRSVIREWPVHRFQLSRIRPHRRHLLGILTDRHHRLPASVAEQARSAVLAGCTVGRRRRIQLRRLQAGFHGSFWRPPSWCGYTLASIAWGR